MRTLTGTGRCCRVNCLSRLPSVRPPGERAEGGLIGLLGSVAAAEDADAADCDVDAERVLVLIEPRSAPLIATCVIGEMMQQRSHSDVFRMLQVRM